MNNRGGFGDRRQGPMQYPPRRPVGQMGPMGPGGPMPPRPMNFRNRGRMGPPQEMMGQPRPMRYRPPMNRGPPNRTNRTGVRLDPDFDFEKANKEFEELENKLSKVDLDGDTNEDKEERNSTSSKDRAGDEKKEDDVFYDKTKSFFDKISCESLQRSKG